MIKNNSDNCLSMSPYQKGRSNWLKETHVGCKSSKIAAIFVKNHKDARTRWFGISVRSILVNIMNSGTCLHTDNHGWGELFYRHCCQCFNASCSLLRRSIPRSRRSAGSTPNPPHQWHRRWLYFQHGEWRWMEAHGTTTSVHTPYKHRFWEKQLYTTLQLYFVDNDKPGSGTCYITINPLWGIKNKQK